MLAYVSMHESTKMMVEHFTNALVERGITVKQFNLTVADLGQLAIALVDAATIVLGSPTVLTGAHPKAAYAAFVANALRPKTRFASIIGSFGWGGKMVDQLTALLTNLKVELIPPVIAKGQPKDEDFAALDNLADQILAKHERSGSSDKNAWPWPGTQCRVGRCSGKQAMGGTPKRSLSVSSGAKRCFSVRTVKQVWPCHPDMACQANFTFRLTTEKGKGRKRMAEKLQVFKCTAAGSVTAREHCNLHGVWEAQL